MFSDVGPLELVTIAVIGVLLFGPDKLPEFLQNAARTVQKIRELSDSAQQEIRSDLGPEFQDFDVRDLHPKAFVRKHVLSGDTGLGRELDAIQEALDPRRELTDAADSLQGAVSLAKPTTSPGDTRPAAFDPDAT
ncbi:sec-independent translocase [Streptomyces endophyticus]|uniref:Sec-independent translocase n=1 Tax=Streptomyces endophyticus TaxID=714166 RepID=A0ABU6F1Q5_9ACTN|nr:sec-independent translocase [Streptomyces endophyticus]MEB8337562.1 sec-independent translocase [Streptomyces endophyticus]